jgi:hypothetical protein
VRRFIKVISVAIPFCEGFFNAITVSALVLTTIATIALFALLYWLELYRVHHWTEKFRLSINVCLYFLEKSAILLRVFLIPDFKIIKSLY